MGYAIRHAQPSDYGRVIQHVGAWWEGRELAPALPKLFFLHFEGTTFVAEDEEGRLIGFLCGFLSQTSADEAYVHLVGVAPERRGSGLGRALYERFFQAARAHGRRLVRAVLPMEAQDALAFHRALGFEVERVARDYDGPGEDRLVLVKRL